MLYVCGFIIVPPTFDTLMVMCHVVVKRHQRIYKKGINWHTYGVATNLHLGSLAIHLTMTYYVLQRSYHIAKGHVVFRLYNYDNVFCLNPYTYNLILCILLKSSTEIIITEL